MDFPATRVELARNDSSVVWYGDSLLRTHVAYSWNDIASRRTHVVSRGLHVRYAMNQPKKRCGL